jgi:UDP-glucose 4-epimerase
MSTVAITGAASRFGRVLLPLLEADPEIEKIIGIDLVAPGEKYSKLEFRRKDVRDRSLKETLAGCDTLVHLAFVVGRPYKMSLQEAASINLDGTWNTCRAAAEAGARKLVVSSSIAAYGGLPDNPNPLYEDSPLRGLYTDFYYSQHKHANEVWLDGFQHEYPDLIISRLRPCIVMGPNQLVTNALPLNGDRFVTTKRGRQGQAQFVHEDDLAQAFYLMIRRDLPGAYNVVGDGVDSLPNLAAEQGMKLVEVPALAYAQLARLSWRTGRTIFGPEWTAGDELRIICSNEKLKAAGWTPRYTTGQSFAATLKALRKQTT